jgi:PAS domain S-box-containing protein
MALFDLWGIVPTVVAGLLLWERRRLAGIARIAQRTAELLRRKRDELHARQRFLGKILDSISDPIFVKDTEHRLVYVNEAECRLSGLKRADMVGKTDYDFFPKEQVDIFWHKDDLVLTTGEEDVNEENITDSDGKLRTIITKKSRYLDREGRAYIVGIIRDITERKEAEEQVRRLNTELEHRVMLRTAELARANDQQQTEIAERKRIEEALRNSERFLNSVVENIPDVVFVKDARELRFVMLNKAGVDMLGFAKEELIGKNDYDFFRKEEADFFTSKDREVLHNKCLLDIPEETIHTRYMGKRILRTKKIPILDNDTIPQYLLGIAEDITQRKDADMELARYRDHLQELIAERTAELVIAKEQADTANRAKSAFLASMSHELRTPLNAVLGYAQILLREHGLNARQMMALGTILQSGEHLLTLIDDILDLSKIEAGKLDLYFDTVNFSAFIRGIADIIEVKAEQKGLQFEFEPSPDLPQAVCIDEKRVRQIMLNLLGNAVKFTDQGRVAWRAMFMHRTDSDALIHFEVQDTGIGMSEEQLRLIFEPFEQVGDVERRYGGTGLGLSISRKLVRMMGSDIHVESTPGEGSIFWFELPVRVETEVPVRADKQMVTGYGGPRKKVLVVDDVAANRDMLVELLGMLGFDVDQAANGLEGLRQAQAEHPDLILMDIMMPVMGGLDATCRILQAPGLQRIPIIAVTASASRHDREQCLAAGVSTFVSKPINQDVLLREIGLCLGLTWITEKANAGIEANADDGLPIVAPPPAEMTVLHELALAGNMRDIQARAAYLLALDAQYRPFATQLRRLAEEFESQAILQMVEGLMRY